MFDVAVANPVYKPAMRQISSITNGFPATVITTIVHSYLTGTILRIDIPRNWGMQQINGLSGVITVTSPTSFTIPIDTTNFDPYGAPGGFPIDDPNDFQRGYPYSYQRPQSVPVGEVTSMLTAAVQNVIPPVS